MMETMELDSPLQSLDRLALAGPLRRALGDDTAEPLDWHSERIAYTELNPCSRGLYHVAGTARVRQGLVPWSLVLKVVCSPRGGILPNGAAVPEGWGLDSSHFQYWKREPLAYQSGLLDHLPGDLVA